MPLPWQEIDNSQEFVAMGMANIAGSFFKTYTRPACLLPCWAVASGAGESCFCLRLRALCMLLQNSATAGWQPHQICLR